MKKILSILVTIIVMIMFVFLTKNNVYGIETLPQYDETFNNNNGIFYANGNPITINKDNEGKTIVYWNGGSQVVPNTITIVGGGDSGTSFEETNIIMEDGTVGNIYGGGKSQIEDKIAKVSNSNIIINGGRVINGIAGGGLLYSNTENANIIVNNGTITDVNGGGMASAVISGVKYSAGSKEKPEESKNRVENAKIIINGGTIDTLPSSFGTVFGGGQGHSYTGNVNVLINGGNLSKAYVIAGGSNGYTKKSYIEINGGNINVLQSVNRGKIESANVLIAGGQIQNAYVGGETEDTSVNGTIDSVNLEAIGGKIIKLNKGTSGGTEINIDQEKYNVIYTEETVDNFEIDEKEIKITYDFKIVNDEFNLSCGSTKKLDVEIKTNPSGYEELLKMKKVDWNSKDNSIAIVDENGIVEGIKAGNTEITAKWLDKQDSINIKVIQSKETLLMFVWILMIVLLLLIILVILELIIVF